jgi:Zn-dependent protease
MLFSGYSLPIVLALLLSLVISIDFHEFAHAWSAVELGDDTPRLQGRLTLNPLAHLDPIGSVTMLLFGLGWGKPVMVSPSNFRDPRRGMMWTAAAGPFMNLILALVAAIPYRLNLVDLVYSSGGVGGGVLGPGLDLFLSVFISTNIGLMLFNLIPVGPLDGANILRGILPREWDGIFDVMQRYQFVIIGALFLLSYMGGLSFLNVPRQLLFGAITGR